MKIARKKPLSRIGLGLLVFAALTLFSMQASATAILLNTASHGELGNAGDGAVQTWLIQSIMDYNTAHGTSLSTAVVGPHPTIKKDVGGDTLSITLPADLNDYLVLHWGGPGGGVFQAFDLSTIPEVADTFNAPSKYGLSSYAFYGTTTTATPEPGTMLLCASGIAGLFGSIRRKLNA